MRLNTNYKNCDTFITLGFETQLNLFSKNHNFEKKKKSSNKYPKKKIFLLRFLKSRKKTKMYIKIILSISKEK